MRKLAPFYKTSFPQIDIQINIHNHIFLKITKRTTMWATSANCCVFCSVSDFGPFILLILLCLLKYTIIIRYALIFMSLNSVEVNTLKIYDDPVAIRFARATKRIDLIKEGICTHIEWSVYELIDGFPIDDAFHNIYFHNWYFDQRCKVRKFT